MRVVLTALGVALAVAFAAAANYGSTIVLGTALAGTGLVLQLLQSTLSTTLQAQLRFGWLSAAELLRQVVNVGLLVALVLAGASTPATARRRNTRIRRVTCVHCPACARLYLAEAVFPYSALVAAAA